MKKYKSPLLTEEKLIAVDVMAVSDDEQQGEDVTLNDNPVDFGNLQNHGIIQNYYD